MKEYYDKGHKVVAIDLGIWVWKVLVSWQDCPKSEFTLDSISYFLATYPTFELKDNLLLQERSYCHI